MSKSFLSKTHAASRFSHLHTDYTEESDFPFTSRTESGQEIIRSIQSVQNLLNELESDHDFQEVVAESAMQKNLIEAKKSKVYEAGEKQTWREVAYSRLDDSQAKLGKLAHSLIDTMDGLLGEGQKQIQCLSDIELLLTMLEKRSTPEAKPSPKSSARKEVSQVVSNHGKILALMVQPQITSKTADKAVQNGHIAEESLLLQDMDRQHYYHMLDALHHLKFSIEVLTPGKIVKPQVSKFVERVNSKG